MSCVRLARKPLEGTHLRECLGFVTHSHPHGGLVKWKAVIWPDWKEWRNTWESLPPPLSFPSLAHYPSVPKINCCITVDSWVLPWSLNYKSFYPPLCYILNNIFKRYLALWNRLPAVQKMLSISWLRSEWNGYPKHSIVQNCNMFPSRAHGFCLVLLPFLFYNSGDWYSF